ncbi:MAG: sigma-70 family RNA polymerase sigma factor [Actinobacteria bacterium]|nr:sigma-70 family RNA polymerase sigma factor [Actinomycetota bacterium]
MVGSAERRSDEELLEAYVSSGGQEAFHELVLRYERRVYAICYRYFGDHADAQDATQDTFLSVARKGGTFRGGSKLSTWIYRIAVNACNDMARKRRRRPQTPVEDIVATSNAAGVGSDDPDPQTLRETELEVHRALAELDETSRTLVVLVAIEGFTYLEAAGIVDMPVGTVKSRVHRAKAELADLLAGVADPEAGIRRSDGTRGAAATSNRVEGRPRGPRTEPPTEEPA